MVSDPKEKDKRKLSPITHTFKRRLQKMNKKTKKKDVLVALKSEIEEEIEKEWDGGQDKFYKE